MLYYHGTEHLQGFLHHKYYAQGMTLESHDKSKFIDEFIYIDIVIVHFPSIISSKSLILLSILSVS